MSHASFRPTRWILGFALVCGASLALAHAARAEGAVQPPFVGSVCLEASDITSNLVDPNGYYAGAPKCELACKRAGRACSQFVKLATMCRNAEIDDDAAFAKTECEVENEHGVQTTTCKTEIEHGRRDGRGGVSDDRNSALDVCDTWEHECEHSCP